MYGSKIAAHQEKSNKKKAFQAIIPIPTLLLLVPGACP
jgi:hypothetical protein